jgi:hypothetical protein
MCLRIDAPQNRSLWTKAKTCVTLHKSALKHIGESMSLQTHLAQLERKHRNLEHEIETELQHANADASKLSGLKRRKLQLKDTITKLKGEIGDKTVH